MHTCCIASSRRCIVVSSFRRYPPFSARSACSSACTAPQHALQGPPGNGGATGTARPLTQSWHAGRTSMPSMTNLARGDPDPASFRDRPHPLCFEGRQQRPLLVGQRSHRLVNVEQRRDLRLRYRLPSERRQAQTDSRNGQRQDMRVAACSQCFGQGRGSRLALAFADWVA